LERGKKKMTRTRCALLAALLIALATAPARAGSDGRPVLMSPGSGDALRAGTEVMIHWDADLPSCVRSFLGEQEISLSVDGGRTFPYRITPRLAYGDRTYTWRVPNLPTDEAVLDLRFGCENQPGECEANRTVLDALNPQWGNRFRILASKADYVGHPLLSAPKDAHPGDLVSLKWAARVRDLDYYEVLASVDRGGQFESIGTTREAAFGWTLPAEGCTYSFKVVAVRTDGSRIESVVDTSQIVYPRATPGPGPGSETNRGPS
jgi:hypothetical protein